MDVIDKVTADSLEIGDYISVETDEGPITDIRDDGNLIVVTVDGSEIAFEPYCWVELLGYASAADI